MKQEEKQVTRKSSHKITMKPCVGLAICFEEDEEEKFIAFHSLGFRCALLWVMMSLTICAAKYSEFREVYHSIKKLILLQGQKLMTK
jgi:hypothetical protein